MFHHKPLRLVLRAFYSGFPGDSAKTDTTYSPKAELADCQYLATTLDTTYPQKKDWLIAKFVFFILSILQYHY